MINVIAIVFVFSLLVLIHELGHFLAAKWMGVRVDKFSIGFPPTIYRKKIGETEFSISAIPLGGYVKMAGFIDESLDQNTTGADYEFNSKPVWRRIIIITAGVIMNLIMAIAIMAILTYTEGEQIIPTTSVGIVTDSTMGQRIGFMPKDKIVSVAGRSVHNWNEIQETFLNHLNQDIPFSVIRSDSSVRLIYKKEWFAEKNGEQLGLVPLLSSKVGEVSYSMPAGVLGLQTGDEITEIAGTPVQDWLEMTKVIRAHPDDEVNISWRRNGKIMSGKIRPLSMEEKNAEGQTEHVGKIGVGYYYVHKEVAAFPALISGFTRTWDLMALNVRGIYWVLTGTKSAKEIIGGPIMIAKMAGDAAKAGWQYLWYLIAALSAMLAFFNILPIPALDGGHLFFLLLEAVMGKPLSVKTRVKVQQIGMTLLLAMIILIVYLDVSRLFF